MNIKSNLSAVGGLAFCAFAVMAHAQPPAEERMIAHQVKPNVYYVEGGGGRTGIIIGDVGVTVIDAKFTMAGGKEFLGIVAKLTSKPVNTVILTHGDGDHVNGLVGFPAGLTIIAQENVRKDLESAIARGDRNALPADHLPTKLVKYQETVTINGVKMELRHWAPAHTSGDLAIYLPAAKVIFTGDLITENPLPLIHRAKGGLSEGWIESVKAMIAFNGDAYVTGHGDNATKADLVKGLAAAENHKAAVKKMVAEGKSQDQIKETVGEKSKPATRFPSYTEVLYQEMTAKD